MALDWELMKYYLWHKEKNEPEVCLDTGLVFKIHFSGLNDEAHGTEPEPEPERGDRASFSQSFSDMNEDPH